MFTLFYWAGCRVSDVSWVIKKNIHVGFKNNKAREIDLLNQARRPLLDFLEEGGNDHG